MGIGLLVAIFWLLYSLLWAYWLKQSFIKVLQADALAHLPILILLLYFPLKYQVMANLGGALLFYAVFGIVMIRLYYLIRQMVNVQKPYYLASAIMLVALLISVLVFFRGIVADGDGIAYYAFPRSLIIDHDLNFENEFAYANEVVGIGMVPDRFPNTGVLRYPYTTGNAISQLPFAFLGHLFAILLNHLGVTVPVDGYSLPYAASVASGSVLYAFVGFCLLLRVLWTRYGAAIAMLSTFGMWFGTVILSMAYLHPASSHGPDLLVTVLFFSYWYTNRDRSDWRSWFFRGALIGLCMWVRPQNVVFVVLLGYDALFTWFQLWKVSDGIKVVLVYILKIGTGVALGWCLAYLPQIVYNLFTCGCAYYTGAETIKLAWLSPDIATVLFGGEHGLFYWTPITIPAVIGLGFMFREDRRLAGGLAFVFAMTVYQIGVFGFFGGAGAGERYLINMTFPLAFGFGAFLNYFSRRISLDWLATAVGGFIVLNVGLLSAYALGLIVEMGRGLVFRDFLWATLIQGPTRMIEFLNNITYFNKPAFAIGSALFTAAIGGRVDPISLESAAWALALIVVLGFVGSFGIFHL